METKWSYAQMLWLGSLIVSLFLLTSISYSLYFVTHSFDPYSEQLNSGADVSRYLSSHITGTKDLGDATKIPTGLFVQSFKFNDLHSATVTGYLWQKYNKEQLQNITPGYIFPEATRNTTKEKYRSFNPSTGLTTVGWDFTASLRQKFNYNKYPLDHKTIWLRIWHSDFEKYIILVPDFESYQSIQPRQKFGLDPDFVLNGFSILETFFNYELVDYDTNFGVVLNNRMAATPELNYNISIKRNVVNALVIHLFPLFVALALLFVTVLGITNNKETQDFFAAKPMSVLKICGSTFFIVMLAHIRLRNQFAGGEIVFIEHVYILLYLFIIFLVFNSFINTAQEKWERKIWLFTYEDNILPKIAFWPIVRGFTQYFIWKIFL